MADTNPEALEAIVHDALNRAEDGGFCWFLRDTHPDDIADDLAMCDKECENFEPADLVRHVESWKLKRNL
jgi:hypothetical protein